MIALKRVADACTYLQQILKKEELLLFQFREVPPTIKDTTDHQLLFEKIDGFNAEAVRAAFRVPEEYLEQLKFSECLPQPYAAEILKDRLLKPACLETLLRKCRKFVVAAKAWVD